jgi:hypothetical protein
MLEHLANDELIHLLTPPGGLPAQLPTVTVTRDELQAWIALACSIKEICDRGEVAGRRWSVRRKALKLAAEIGAKLK